MIFRDQTLPDWAVEYDEISWFRGFAPGTPFGTCDHKCDHGQVATIARGPGGSHSALVACISSGCNKTEAVQCRAWFSQNSNRRGPWRAVWVNRG